MLSRTISMACCVALAGCTSAVAQSKAPLPVASSPPAAPADAGSGRPAGPAPQPPVVARAVPQSDSSDPALGFECESSCGDGERPEPTIEVRWQSGPQAALGALPRQRLETTVYKDGFERGQFVAVQPSAQPAARAFQVQKAAQRAAMPKALTQLKVVVPRRSQQRALSSASAPRMRVQGVEPGVNYFWRISFEANNAKQASTVIRCRAPICPSDQQERSVPRRP